MMRQNLNFKHFNEYLSWRGNEYSMLGFDIDTVIGLVMVKT